VELQEEHHAYLPGEELVHGVHLFISLWIEMLYLYLKRDAVNGVPIFHGVGFCSCCTILVGREVVQDILLYLVNVDAVH
jgi:hypothetical protein